MKFKGVFPPMITPFESDGKINLSHHVENVEKWNDDNLAGYLVLGSNSETVFLNEREKLKLIEITVKYASKDRVILAGTGMESAIETISLTNKAADLGAQAALILTPHYYHSKMNDEAQIRFYTEVADQSKIPILIYNVPAFSRINVSNHVVSTLSHHPNIVGMKDSTGNIPQIISFQKVIADDFQILLGTASAWYPALQLGIKAGIFALSNCAPNECTLVQQSYEEGNVSDSEKIYRRIFPVNTAVTATYGIPGLKYASELLGYHGGCVRNPLKALNEKDQSQLRSILEEAELI